MESNFTLFPIEVEVERGMQYHWCGCGQSTTHPVCDKSGDCKKCVEFKARLTETLYFCGCGQTKNPPLCDGTHGRLLMRKIQDDRARDQKENY